MQKSETEHEQEVGKAGNMPVRTPGIRALQYLSNAVRHNLQRP